MIQKILLALVGILLVVLLAVKFKRVVLFWALIAALIFIAYKLGLFSWALKAIFGI